MIELPIIDVDTHFTEPRDLWTMRAPAKFKGHVLEVRTDAAGVEGWWIGDSFVAPLGYCVIADDLKKHRGMLTLPTLDAMTAARGEAAPRLDVMDSFGIAAALMYPNVVGFGSQKLMEMSADPKLRLFLVEAYNDAIAELQKQSKGRLFPQAVLPLWDIELTLRELKRCREDLELTGIVMSDSPEHFGQPHLADPIWAPFWETCQDLRLPINFHVGSGEHNKMEGYWADPNEVYHQGHCRDPYAVCYTSSSMWMMNAKGIMNLIISGMLEKYPHLNFVSVESGVGWVPYLIQTLEYTIDELLTPEERRSRFKRSPKEQFQQQIYTSYWFEGVGNVRNYIEEFGAGNIMFETDFPHPQCLYPDVRTKVNETLGEQPVDVQRKVLFENASRLYGIDILAVASSRKPTNPANSLSSVAIEGKAFSGST